MPRPSAKWGDKEVEEVISTLLRVGLIVAAGIVLGGGVCYLIRHGFSRPDYRVFRGERSDLRSVGGILQGVVSLRCRDVIQLGLVFLMATPVARVAFSVVAFAKERDGMYAVITLIVLAVLTYSFVGGPSVGLR